MGEKLDLAAKKWAQDVRGKGSAYKSGVENPSRNPCQAFKDFVGQESMATKKYCTDYDNFKSNVGQYESLWTAGVDRAISNDSYKKGLTR